MRETGPANQSEETIMRRSVHSTTPAIALALVLATTLGTTPVTGEAASPGVDKRQHHQRDRIHQGVHSGELTGREARRLAHTQRHLQREERRYKSDGVLTRRERADLHRDLSRSSRQIYRQKHDGQDRND